MKFRKLDAPFVAFLLFVVFSTAQLHHQSAYSFSSQAKSERELKTGDSLEIEVGPAEVKVYSLGADENDYIHLLVNQRGVNVSVSLIAPDGTRLVEINDQKFRQGSERLYWILKTKGRYQIEVRSLEKEIRGEYQIRVEVIRKATNADALRVQALQIYWGALRLRDQPDDASRKKAIDEYLKAMEIFRSAGDKWGEAATLHKIGLVYWDLKDGQKAIEYMSQAAPLFHAISDLQGEASALSDQGAVYGNDETETFDLQKAITLYEAALPIAQAAGDKEVEARTLYKHARALDRGTGNYAKAIELYQASVAPSIAAGDVRLLAYAFNNMGMAYFDSGEPYEALKRFEQALPAIRAVGDRGSEAGYLSNAAMALHVTGENQKALDTLDQALEICRKENFPDIEPYALQLRGNIFTALGETERAIESYEQTLKIERKFGMNGEIRRATLVGMGDTYLNANQYQKALEAYSEALQVKVPDDSREFDPSILTNIANTHVSLGNVKKAFALLEQAKPLFNENDKMGKTMALEVLGRAYLVDDQPQKAVAAFTEAQKLRDSFEFPEDIQVSVYRAKALMAEGELNKARAQAEATLEHIESVRSSFISPEFRASFFATQQEAYYTDIDLLMDLNQQDINQGLNRRALEVSEARRARSLLEGLSAARANIRRGVALQLLEKEQTLSKRLNAKQQLRLRLAGEPHSEEQVTAVDKEITALLQEYQLVQDQIRKASPEYSSLTHPQKLSAKDIQSLLDPDSLLLEYSLGPEHCFVWAVTSTSINTFELPKRSEIEAASKSLYGLLTARQPVRGETQEQYVSRVKASDQRYQNENEKLSRLLLGPVASSLTKKRLLIVSDGSLEYLPFGAFVNPGAQALVSNHEIVYLPSVATLQILRKRILNQEKPTRTLAVFADPVFDASDDRVAHKSSTPQFGQVNSGVAVVQRAVRDVGLADDGVPLARLPFSRQEADSIASFIPRTDSLKAIGFQANLATATNPNMSDYRIVHFATHALVNPNRPFLSGLLLSLVDQQGKPQDGFLSLNEIYNMHLTADLVVLSACQTATGKEVKGEGIIGLARAFMYAGTPRVIASLWKVDDAATAEMVKRFYRGLLVEKLRPAAALQKAQFEMSKSKLWASPYYWAGFVLQGEPN